VPKTGSSCENNPETWSVDRTAEYVGKLFTVEQDRQLYETLFKTEKVSGKSFVQLSHEKLKNSFGIARFGDRDIILQGLQQVKGNQNILTRDEKIAILTNLINRTDIRPNMVCIFIKHYLIL
jgi:hypothetical protein